MIYVSHDVNIMLMDVFGNGYRIAYLNIYVMERFWNAFKVCYCCRDWNLTAYQTMYARIYRNIWGGYIQNVASE